MIQPQSTMKTAFPILLMIGMAHLSNDLIQSMLTAIYPLLQVNFALEFAQIGLISLVYQMTASILQPGIGFFTDRKPKPYFITLWNVSDSKWRNIIGLCD